MMDASQVQTPVDNPELYTAAFSEDGTVSIKADCNQVSGSYARGDENSLTITIGPSTLAACPEGSRSEQFLQLLGSASSYGFLGGSLAIVSITEDGPQVMMFKPSE